MAFPTSSLTNNQVHKEGNRAFVYDSTLGTWDQVREADRTENKILSGEIGAGATFPADHMIFIDSFIIAGGASGADTGATDTGLTITIPSAIVAKYSKLISLKYIKRIKILTHKRELKAKYFIKKSFLYKK